MDFNLTPELTYDENSEDFNTEDFSEICVHLNIPAQNENNEEQIILLNKGANSIGRDKSCDIVINNQVLSRHHAVIEVDKYSCLIYDVGSRNKTWKGRLLLKPNVRYNLENKENIRLANVKAFIIIEEAKKECLSLKCEAIKEIAEDEESETGSESMITHEEYSPKLTDVIFSDNKNASSQHLETVSNNKNINVNFNDKILINQSILQSKEKNKSNNDAINYEMLINVPTQRFESYIDSGEDTKIDEKLMNVATQHYSNCSKSSDDAIDDDRLMNAPTQNYHNNSKSGDDVTDDETLMNAPTQHYHNNSKSADDVTDDERLMNAPTQHCHNSPKSDKDVTDDKRLMNAPTQHYNNNSESDDDVTDDERLMNAPTQHCHNSPKSDKDVTDDERLMNAPTQHCHNSPKSDKDVTDDERLMNAPTQCYHNSPKSNDDITDDYKLMNVPTEAFKICNSSSNYMTDDEKLMNAPTQKYDTNISSEESSNDESLLKEASQTAISSIYISENHSDLVSNNNKIASSNYLNIETVKIFQSPNTDENLLSEETQAYLNNFLDNIEEDFVTTEVCNQENNENMDKNICNIIQNDEGNIKENQSSCPKECIENVETQIYLSDVKDKLINDEQNNEIINQQNEIANVETQAYSSDVYNELKNDKEICETINQKNESNNLEEKSICSILNSEKSTSLIDIDMNNQKLENTSNYKECFISKMSSINSQQSKFLMEESVADISLNEILCISTQPHDNEEEKQIENLDYEYDYLAETQELQSDKNLINNTENSNGDDSEIPPVPDDYVAETPPHLLDLTLSESDDNGSEKSEVLIDLNVKENKYFDKSEVTTEQINNVVSENNSFKITKNSLTKDKSKNLGMIEEENSIKTTIEKESKGNFFSKEEGSDLDENEQIKLKYSRINSSQEEKSDLLKQEAIKENDYFYIEDKKNIIENKLRNIKQISTIDSSLSSREMNNLMKILTEEESDFTSVEKTDMEKNIQNSSDDLSQKENSLSNSGKMIIEEIEHPSLEELNKCETVKTKQKNFQEESSLNNKILGEKDNSSDDENYSVKNEPIKVKEKNNISSSKTLASLSKVEATVYENKTNSSKKKSCKNNNNSLKTRQKKKLNLSHMEEVDLKNNENEIINNNNDSAITDNEFSKCSFMKSKKGKKSKSSFQKKKVNLTKTHTALIEENSDLSKDNETTNLNLNDHYTKDEKDVLIKNKKIKTRQKSKIDSYQKEKNRQQTTIIGKETVAIEKNHGSNIENKNISKCEPMQTRHRKKINLSEKQEEHLSNLETILINENNVFSGIKNNLNNLCDDREKNQIEFEYEKELNLIDSKLTKNKNDSSDIKENSIIVSEKVNEPNIKTQTDDLQQTHKITDDSPGTKLEICVGKLKELTKTKKLKQEISNNESITSNGNKKSLRKQKTNISKIIKNEEELRQSSRKRKLNKCILENENKNTDDDMTDYVTVIENKKRKSYRLAKAENEVDSSNNESNIEKTIITRGSNETTGKNDHFITLKQKEKNHNAKYNVISKKDKFKIIEESSIEQDSESSGGDKLENFMHNNHNEDSQFRKNKRNLKKKEHPEYILYPLKKSKRNNTSNNSCLEMSSIESSMENDELKPEIKKTRSKCSLTTDQNKNVEKFPKTSDYNSSEKVKQQTENKKRKEEFLKNNKSPKKQRNTPSKTESKQFNVKQNEMNESNQIIVSTRKRTQKNEETEQMPIKIEVINDKMPKRSKRLSMSSSSDSNSLINESNLSSSPNKKTSLKNKKQTLNTNKDASQRLTISPKEKTKKIKIMFTGMNESGDHKIVTKLGGEIVDDPKLCTHLVTDKFHRTVKFLCCVAKGIPVVVTKWLHACRNKNKIIDHSEFLLKDSSAEKQYKFDLKNTLSKAEQEPLLKGWSIHATNKVKPLPEQMKDIVQFAGGKYLSRMPTRFADKTVIISCPEDLKTCKHAAKCGIPIVGTEYLLTGLLKYENNITSYPFFIFNHNILIYLFYIKICYTYYCYMKYTITNTDGPQDM